MKRTLFLLAFSLVSVLAIGQSSEAVLRKSTGAATDTVSNTGSGTLSFRAFGAPDAVAVQAVLTKVSGTTAGTVRLFASIDGVNYDRINKADSLVATNVAAQSKIFLVPSPAYNFYRVVYAGSGSHSTVLSAVALTIKK